MDKEHWMELLKSGHVLDILINYWKFKNEPYAKELIEKSIRYAVDNDPTIALEFADLYKSEPFAKKAIEQAAANGAKGNTFGDIYQTLSYVSIYINEPYAKAVIEKAVRNAAEKEPGAALLYADLYKNEPYAREIIERAVRGMANYPGAVFTSAELYVDQPYAKEVLFPAAEKSPLDALYDIDVYKNKAFGKELIAKACHAIFEDKDKIRELIENINIMHERPASIRFAVLPFLTSGQKYDLIINAREEMYTSTYLTVVDSLFSDLKKKHQSLDKLLSPKQMESLDVFLEAAAGYNRIDQALGSIANTALPTLLRSVVGQCSAPSKGLESAVTLATIINSSPQNKTLRTVLENELHQGYDKSIVDKGSRHRYGLLASLYTQNYKGTVIADQKAFFDKIGDMPLYSIPTLSGLNQPKLTDKNGVCNQLMVFESDDDSIASYKNWKMQYQDRPGWETVDQDHYTVIKKTNGKVPVYIYANKPEVGTEAVKEIKEAVAKSQGSGKADFQVFIGRGHSYHANEYLSYLSDNIGLVHLGSCGGYSNLSKVLKIDPHAQVIATRQRGSMYINDPLLFNINRSINETGHIIWKQQEIELEKIHSEDKSAYLMPDKNIGLELLQYYERIKDEPTISFTCPMPSTIQTLPLRVPQQKSVSIK